MKSLLPIICVFFFAAFGYSVRSQAPIIDWTKTFGGSGIDKANSIKPTSDGGYIVAGVSYSTDGDITGSPNTAGNMWIVKLSSTGTIQWQKSFGGTLEDGAESIRQTSDGGYIVVGFAKSVDGDVVGNHGTGTTDDAWVIKLNSSGNLVWQKCFGGIGFDVAYDVIQTTDGGFAICGSSGSNTGDITDNQGGYDFWLIKITATGTLQWNKSYGGTLNDVARSIKQLSDGGYVLAGSTSSSNGNVVGFHGSSDYWVIRTSSAGALQWQIPLGGTGSEVAYSIESTPDGGFVVGGVAASNNGDVFGNDGGNDMWVVKLSAAGVKVWQKCLGGTSYEIGQAIDVTELGQIVVVGHANSLNGDVSGHLGGGDFWIVQLSPTGVVQWQKCIGGTGVDWAYAMDATGSGSFILCGITESSNINVPDNNGARDFYVTRLLPDPLAVDEQFSPSFNLVVHANQGVADIRITDSLLNQQLTISDMLGAAVKTELLTSTTFSLDISALPAGVYLLTIDGLPGIAKKFLKH